MDDDSSKSLGKTFGIFFAIFGAIIIPVSVYTARSVVAKVMSFISLWWFLAIFISLIISIAFCMVVATVYTLGWRFGRLKPRYTNVSRLLLAVLCASLIAYFAPVVSTPEQLYFERHKSEFEQQVELIKKGSSISHFGNLRMGMADKSHAVIFAYISDDLNFNSSYAYIYTEQYSDLDDIDWCNNTKFKGGEGHIYATLSTNWYLCYRADDW